MSKRASLANFAPKLVNADGARVESSPTPTASSKSGKTYPKISVYLEADEVRTLKLIGIDTGQRISDVCATALREWLERNGHARGKLYKA